MAEAPAFEEDVEDDLTIVPVPDQKLVGLVIGKGGQTIRRLMKETSTYIHYEKDENVFIIKGGAEGRYAAKLKVKEIISNGLKTQTDTFKACCRFPFVDLNGHGFVLEQLQHVTSYPAFKVALKDSSISDPESRTTDYSNFTSQIFNVLQSIHQESKEDMMNNIWSHFGHIYLSNVGNDEKTIEFNAQELLSHVEWDNASNATKWRTKFVGGIVDGTETHDLLGWMASRLEKDFPFIRYEFVYFTPSCRVIRVKIFLAIDATNNQVTYRNVPKCEPVSNLIKSSENPYFYFCGSTDKRAMVNVFQPAEKLDFRFIIDSGQKFQADVEGNEVDTLFNYIRDNMNVKPNEGLGLPQEKLPSDFDLCYARVSERRTYPFTSEDGEKFTVKLSYEYALNNPNTTSETTMDIHLRYDDWDRMLEDGTWTPQKVVDKIPQFMRCASALARILKTPETTPAEIFARGPKAQEAYETALKSGKTKYCRVLVVLVGQSGAGKTSLLRSLRHEEFNPHEDSTEGVRIHRSLSKVDEDIWHKDMTFMNSFVDCTARAVAENLSSSFNHSPEKRSCQEDVEEGPLLKVKFDYVSDEKSGIHGHAEESNKSLDGEGRKAENEHVTADEDESVEENPSTPSDLTPFKEGTKNSPIPAEVSERAISILQNPEVQESQECVHLVTLDFAGQPVYNATHPVFLPKKAIYILVNSLENEIHAKATPVVKHGSLERKIDDHCPMTNMDHLEFWLSFVASLWTSEGVSLIDDNALALLRTEKKAPKTEQKPTTKEAKLPRRLPPVFLVCTHADVPFKDNDAKKMTREIFSYLKSENKASGGNHIVRGLYTVNNTVSGKSEEKSVEELRAHIYQIAKSLPYVNEVVPIRWLQFEKKLSDLAASENKKYISLEEGKSVAKQCQIADHEEFNTVLNYLHDLKVIIYFEETKIIIIDIQWLLNMIVRVITVQLEEEWDDDYEEQWKRLENEGILERALIDHVWENATTANSLLMIMEKFSLICRWKRHHDPDMFLVPSMLMNSDAKAANELLSDEKTSKTLVVRFKSAHLPLGIFPRLLVVIARKCNEKWPNSPQPKFFHNFCRFYDVGDIKKTRKSFDLVVTSDIKTINFSVINEQGIMGLHLKDLCRFIVDFLRETLQTMCTSFPWMKGAEYEFCIQCPKCYPSSELCKCHSVSGCTRDACVHFITENELRSKQARCYRNHTGKSTFFEEDIYSDWFDVITKHDDQETTNSNAMQVVTETVQLLALNGTPSTLQGSQNHEIVSYAGQDTHCRELALPESTPVVIAQFKKLIEDLGSYKTSMRDPPAEMTKMCRDVCRQLKGVQRKSLIEELRKMVPSGTTGPSYEENEMYYQLQPKMKENLTKGLCGQEMLKRLLDKFGQSKSFAYYDRQRNPVENLFEEQSKKGNLTVGVLYDILVHCEANAIADECL